MERRALGMSLALHGIILILMFCNFSFMREYSKPPAVVLQIDLNKVQISQKTNLPQKQVAKKEIKKVPAMPEKKQVAQVKKVSKPVQKTESVQVKPKEAPVPKNAVQTQVKPVKQETKPLPEQKTTESKAQDDWQSLLASVDKIRQAPQKKEMIEGEVENMEGLTGGLEGRLDQIMTISDKDFISSKLRDCWNVDGGTERLDEIVVDVRLSVNKDGDLLYVKYTNKMNVPAFTQVAESAVRAVHICAQKGEDSPFKILADKYADHYSDWKEMSLRFSPTEGIY